MIRLPKSVSTALALAALGASGALFAAPASAQDSARARELCPPRLCDPLPCIRLPLEQPATDADGARLWCPPLPCPVKIPLGVSATAIVSDGFRWCPPIPPDPCELYPTTAPGFVACPPRPEPPKPWPFPIFSPAKQATR